MVDGRCDEAQWIGEGRLQVHFWTCGGGEWHQEQCLVDAVTQQLGSAWLESGLREALVSRRRHHVPTPRALWRRPVAGCHACGVICALLQSGVCSPLGDF